MVEPWSMYADTGLARYVQNRVSNASSSPYSIGPWQQQPITWYDALRAIPKEVSAYAKQTLVDPVYNSVLALKNLKSKVFGKPSGLDKNVEMFFGEMSLAPVKK